MTKERDETTTATTTGMHIETPSVDNREYKHVTLGGTTSNASKLEVLLISDPDTDKSSAAMDIGIGQLCDGDTPGIAHFSEHMLFIGTEKYPDENAYDSFLNAHGGSSNAFTDLEHTCYYFDVQAASLGGAFDRFAQCFIAPLFTKSALEREVQAVDSEHAKNLMQDMWRTHQLSKSKLAPADHPYASFGSGNAQSLPTVTSEKESDSDNNNNDNNDNGDGDDNGTHIRERLLEFFQKYYRRSLQIYKLVVLGKETVADLESMVQRYFGELIDIFEDNAQQQMSKNNNDHTPSMTHDEIVRDLYPGPGSWNVPQRLHVVPISQVHSLEMQFPMREIKSLYRAKPTRYLSHLLGHEGRGSLLSLLKSRQYATELFADDSTKSCASFSVFTINIELTERGLESVDEIVSMVFAYMDLLRSEGPQKWIQTESQTISDMQFRFLSQRNPMDYTSSLAAYMQEYPPSLYLSGAYKTFDWDADLVTECLKSLVPENLFMMVASPTFGSCEDDGNNISNNNSNEDEKKDEHETEKWYGTKYSTIEPNETLWNEWKSINHGMYPALALPHVNDMVATDFEILEPSSKESSFPKDKPQCVYQDRNVRLWYKPDNIFDMPKVNIMYRFSSGQGSYSPDAIVAAQLFSEMVTEQCNEFSYEATMAGLYCQIAPSPDALELQVSGYNHKAHVLMERLVDTMMGLLAAPSTDAGDSDGDGPNLSGLWDRVSFKMEQAYQSFLVGQPYQHCIYGGNLVLQQKIPIEDKMNALKTITLPEVLTFARGFFKHCHLEGLIHGNVSAQHAYDITNMVWSKTHPLQINSLEATITRAPLENRIVQFLSSDDEDSSSPPSFLYSFPEFNASNPNSCVEIVLQMGALDLESNSTLALFGHLIQEPAYNQLRTEEQLGYIVHSSIKTSGDNIKGLVLLIQSDSFYPDHVEERIEVFLAEFRQKIVDMSEEDFQKFRDTVVAIFLEKVRLDLGLRVFSHR